MIPRRGLWLRRAMRRFGLPERLLAILVLMAAMDFGANAVLFDRASNFALRSDDAARIAENLVIASRALEAEEPAQRPALAERLSSPRFSLAWKPRLAHADDALPLDRLRAQVLDAAPELAAGDPRFSLRSLASPGSVNGAMLLKDGTGVVFRTQASEAWTLNAGRLAVLLLPTPLLVVLAWVLFRATIRPLKALVSATGRVGAGPPEALIERGPDEVRRLIRAFNRMQSRIYRQMLDRTQSMLAIGHDLRTPLARLRLRLDDAGIDRETQADMVHDIDEMMHLLASLQAYVEGEGRQIPAEPVDLAAMAMTLVDNAYDHGGDARYEGEDSLVIQARAVSLRRALGNLVENALHYAGHVEVTVRRTGDFAEVVVADRGPGIPSDRLDDVTQPFVRLDAARGRDTPGMGLGLAIVKRAIRAEGGTLILANRSASMGGSVGETGLIATVRLPLKTPQPHAAARK
ncbi:MULTISPECIES: ATP-binding protein [unclassified Novosphingobium]|uniref:ATP-binding protein n=1 Tax=unclassified Novosphingobium TaxID=2644732 RepID=UPI0017CC619F|nr:MULTISPECIES: ATP-binding protein [unclassified Novosphingobium]NMN02888.1 signal transduction histidine kinase [Novosphingobium sp. SG919]NMN87125.1 signal transduction histidine kinase [Novosphingobium sp. SG916]